MIKKEDIPDVVGLIISMFEKENRRYPCYTNRASELGYAVPLLQGCERRGCYARTNWKDREPFDTESLMRLKEGVNQEAIVLRDLAAAGIQVIEQQSAFTWEEYCLSGHLDGIIVVNGVSVPVEIKSMSDIIFDGIRSFDDFNKYPWTRAYKCQIMLYMLSKNIDWGIFVLKSKGSGKIKQVNVPLDYELGEACLKAAEAINKHIADGTLPERITDRETCKKCPFKTICLPEINFGEELKIVDDPAFEKRLETYVRLKPASAECAAEYEVIKSRIKATAAANGGNCNLMIGKYQVTGTQGDKKFTVKILAI